MLGNKDRYEEIMVDVNHAPEGYHAIPKSKVKHRNDNGNICMLYCDLYPNCNTHVPCMSYSRPDKIGVVFKRDKII